MAEAFNDITLSADKATRYAEVADEIASVLDGEPNVTARMATVASMLANSFDHYFWTGFYVVDPDKAGELVVGPYQGTLGCLRIAFGRGVCGTAAALRETQVVADVHAGGRPMTVCGETAADPLGAVALAALGVDVLSVPVNQYAAARAALAGLSAEALAALGPRLLQQRTARDVRQTLHEWRAGLGGVRTATDSAAGLLAVAGLPGARSEKAPARGCPRSG